MRKFLLTSILLASAVILIGCKTKTAPPAGESSVMTAPDFTLKNYDGKEHKLSNYRGKVVVLEWFNYECPFCLHHYQATTEMVDLANKYAEKGVVWLAINSTSHQTTDKNIAFAKKYDVPFPILDDRDGKVGNLYKAERTPEMFVIDKDGMVVYHGAIDNAPVGKVSDESGVKVDYVAKALDELLAGKEITTPKTKPYGCTVKYAK